MSAHALGIEPDAFCEEEAGHRCVNLDEVSQAALCLSSPGLVRNAGKPPPGVPQTSELRSRPFDEADILGGQRSLRKPVRTGYQVVHDTVAIQDHDTPSHYRLDNTFSQ